MEVLGLIFMVIMLIAFIVAVPLLFGALFWSIWMVFHDR